MADEPRESLRRLEERLSTASSAAERLIAEAARTGLRGKPPPAGWQTAPEERPPEERRDTGERDTLLAAWGAMRELIPPDVLERLMAALKELLLALRSLIDAYLERIERRRTEPTVIEDIPIS
jgi:hypothetical protein